MKRILGLALILLLPVSAALALAVDSGTMAAASASSSSKILVWRTGSFLIRVDVSEDSQYRFALWDSSKDLQDIPETIIVGGTLNPCGSAGSYYYEFTSGKTAYRCLVTPGTGGSPPGYLVILNDDKEILRESVLEVISGSS